MSNIFRVAEPRERLKDVNNLRLFLRLCKFLISFTVSQQIMFVKVFSTCKELEFRIELSKFICFVVTFLLLCNLNSYDFKSKTIKFLWVDIE